MWFETVEKCNDDDEEEGCKSIKCIRRKVFKNRIKIAVTHFSIYYMIGWFPDRDHVFYVIRAENHYPADMMKYSFYIQYNIILIFQIFIPF